MKYLLIIFLSVSGIAFAASNLVETRYCGVQRDDSGRIKRSARVVKEFEKLYPLPAEYSRSDWQVDHVIPLAVGGCDSVSNMQWLPKTIKTCGDNDCKDRWERAGIYDGAIR